MAKCSQNKLLKILTFLSTGEARSAHEINDGLGFAEGTILYIMKDLKNQGFVAAESARKIISRASRI
jgi:predicted transcriptional regulator